MATAANAEQTNLPSKTNVGVQTSRWQSLKMPDTLMTAADQLAQAIAAHGKGRKAWYNEVYLRSQHWKDLKQAKYDKQGHKCERCPCRAKLQVHHNDYRSIFDVTIEDLEVLCDECHSREHGKSKPSPWEIIIVTTPANQHKPILKHKPKTGVRKIPLTERDEIEYQKRMATLHPNRQSSKQYWADLRNGKNTPELLAKRKCSIDRMLKKG